VSTYHWLEERSAIDGDPSTWYLREDGSWRATVWWSGGKWHADTCTTPWSTYPTYETLKEAKAAALIELRFK
jgi:hypothetical protein